MNIYADLPDAILVRLLIEHDDAAFAEIYERYWYALCSHAIFMLKDKELGRDVVQDVFFTLLLNSGKLNPTLSLKSFLYTCLKNRVISHIRREQVEAKYLDSLRFYIPPNYSPADQLVLEKELAEQIEAEISALPPKMRTVFELSHRQQLNTEEIAIEISANRHTVKKQLQEAVKKIKNKFSPHFSISGIGISILLSRFFS